MCGLTDLYATCADLVGEKVEPNAGEDSFSMLPLFFQTPEKYTRTNAVHHDFGGRFAFREGKWKLVPNADSNKCRLFDLEADVSEKNNLYKAYPEVVKQLEANFRGSLKPAAVRPEYADKRRSSLVGATRLDERGIDNDENKMLCVRLHDAAGCLGPR